MPSHQPEMDFKAPAEHQNYNISARVKHLKSVVLGYDPTLHPRGSVPPLTPGLRSGLCNTGSLVTATAVSPPISPVCAYSRSGRLRADRKPGAKTSFLQSPPEFAYAEVCVHVLHRASERPWVHAPRRVQQRLIEHRSQLKVLNLADIQC